MLTALSDTEIPPPLLQFHLTQPVPSLQEPPPRPAFHDAESNWYLNAPWPRGAMNMGPGEGRPYYYDTAMSYAFEQRDEEPSYDEHQTNLSYVTPARRRLSWPLIPDSIVEQQQDADCQEQHNSGPGKEGGREPGLRFEIRDVNYFLRRRDTWLTNRRYDTPPELEQLKPRRSVSLPAFPSDSYGALDLFLEVQALEAQIKEYHHRLRETQIPPAEQVDHLDAWTAWIDWSKCDDMDID